MTHVKCIVVRQACWMAGASRWGCGAGARPGGWASSRCCCWAWAAWSTRSRCSGRCWRAPPPQPWVELMGHQALQVVTAVNTLALFWALLAPRPRSLGGSVAGPPGTADRHCFARQPSAHRRIPVNLGHGCLEGNVDVMSATCCLAWSLAPEVRRWVRHLKQVHAASSDLKR